MIEPEGSSGRRGENSSHYQYLKCINALGSPAYPAISARYQKRRPVRCLRHDVFSDAAAGGDYASSQPDAQLTVLWHTQVYQASTALRKDNSSGSQPAFNSLVSPPAEPGLPCLRRVPPSKRVSQKVELAFRKARIALWPSKKRIRCMVEKAHALTELKTGWQESTEVVGQLNRA